MTKEALLEDLVKRAADHDDQASVAVHDDDGQIWHEVVSVDSLRSCERVQLITLDKIGCSTFVPCLRIHNNICAFALSFDSIGVLELSFYPRFPECQ